MERLATKVRHLQRTEVLKRKNISRKAKGSLAMPHKRNPVLTENWSGAAGARYGGASHGKCRAV